MLLSFCTANTASANPATLPLHSPRFVRKKRSAQRRSFLAREHTLRARNVRRSCNCRTANVKYDWPYLTARRVRFTCNYDLYRDVTLLRATETSARWLSPSFSFPRSFSLPIPLSGRVSLQSVHDMPAGVTRNEMKVLGKFDSWP